MSELQQSGGNTVRNTAGLMPAWKPGQSGNPNGRPKRKPFAEEVIRQATPEKIEAAVKVLFAQMARGNLLAMRIFIEILDGKDVKDTEPTQVITNVMLT